MNLRPVLFLGFSVFVAQPALAQQAPATDPTAASVYGLMASGYEVKAVTTLSESAEKIIWAGATSAPQVVITLQKGSSLAICNLAAANWLILAGTSLTDTSRCAVH
jgi:hypothetical protein